MQRNFCQTNNCQEVYKIKLLQRRLSFTKIWKYQQNKRKIREQTTLFIKIGSIISKIK